MLEVWKLGALTAISRFNIFGNFLSLAFMKITHNSLYSTTSLQSNESQLREMFSRISVRELILLSKSYSSF